VAGLRQWQSDGADSDSRRRGPRNKIYLAFAPWVLFSLIARRGNLQVASVVALAASVAIALPGVLTRRPKVLEIGAVVAFAAFCAVAFAASPAPHWVSQYARAIAAALLALIAFGSLLLTPFTEQYARESVPREFWSTSRFRRINRRLTLLWAFVFTAMVPSHVVAVRVGTSAANVIFNWLIPIVLVVWAAKRTAEISGSADRAGPAGNPEGLGTRGGRPSSGHAGWLSG
jgi:hypothetical protein